ncbi:asparagine synthetase B, partial [Candidatus Woesearchaeota archaeon]|nr:asparagine synthetase B [Candidatus Woesearchaeota archaeon]
MCGIVGFNWIDKKLIVKMLNSLHHRGPDQSGYKFYTNLTFGHKRLSIQDLSECGKQPMELDDYSIVFNGEIFNFIELKHELNKRNIKFKSNTDTEVILYYYKYYGEKCLDYFNGQFSFAIYDKKKQTIFIARDRMGIKPLYYYLDGETFIFASELKAILE